MKRFFKLLILVPLGILLVVFAVANRGAVTVSLDPFDPTAPALALRLPLFVLLFFVLAVGVFVGGVSSWLRQGKWRKLARVSTAEAGRLRRTNADANGLPAPMEPLQLH